MSKRNSQAGQVGGPRAAARRAGAAGQEGQARRQIDRRRLASSLSSRSPAASATLSCRRTSPRSGTRPPRTEAGQARPTPRARTARTVVDRQVRAPRRPSSSTRTRAARSAPASSRPSAQTVDKDVEGRQVQAPVTIGATFLDRNLKGEGSKNALSALGAALNVSPEAFVDYKTALYSKEYHPAETTDSSQGRLPDQDREHGSRAQEQRDVPEGRRRTARTTPGPPKMSKSFETAEVAEHARLSNGRQEADRDAEERALTVSRRRRRSKAPRPTCHGAKRRPAVTVTWPTERANFSEFARSCRDYRSVSDRS